VSRFSLQPFCARDLNAFALGGDLSRADNTCRIRYELSGPLALLQIQPPATPTARKDQLWQETCFEMFWKKPGEAGYWELNVSPAGHWNVYGFTGYREGMAPETRITGLTVNTQQSPELLALELIIDLGPLLPGPTQLEFGISAILAHRDRTKSFWALAHGADQPDFHRQDGFRLRL